MKKRATVFGIVLLIGLFVFANWAGAGIISPDRRIDWSQAGVPGGIPDRTTVCATLSPGATLSQINSAIQNCPANQVVYLSSGTYNIAGQIEFNNKKNVTLRGAGADQTQLVWSSAGDGAGLGATIYINNGDDNYGLSPKNTASWTSGYAMGTTVITLSSTRNLHVGSQLYLDQLDDSSPGDGWFVSGSTSYSQQGGTEGFGRPGRFQVQVVVVQAINGNQVTIKPGVYLPNFRSSQSPGAWWSNNLPATGIGIEDMTLDFRNAGNPIGGIFAWNTEASWIKGCRILNRLVHKHIWLYGASRCTVRDNYFYGSTGTSESYGVDVGPASSDVLVENNIFDHVTAPILQEDTTGLVGAYNYAKDDYYIAWDAWQQGSFYHHHAGDAMVLWEGNIGVGVYSDDIHGTSNGYTVFRNYLYGLDIGEEVKTASTNALMIEAFNRFYNYIGNVLGTAGYFTHYEHIPTSSTDPGSSDYSDHSIYNMGYSANQGTYWSGPPSIPNDVLTATGSMRWGNYDSVSGTVRWNADEVPNGLNQYANPVPGDHNLPASLYLAAKPSWWSSNIPWPAIGPDVSGGNIAGVGGHVYKIPAQVCYENTPKTGAILEFNADDCYPTGQVPSDTTPPVRSNGGPSGTLAYGTTSTTISLSTDEAATCRYSTTAGVSYASMTHTFSTTGGTAHSTAVAGLTNGGSYNYYVRCVDGAGNANTDDSFAISFSVASQATSCTSDADADGDSVVSTAELIDYVSEWKSGSVSISDLIAAIDEWKNGC